MRPPEVGTTNMRRLIEHLYPDGKLQRMWQLSGGVSAQITAVSIQHLNDRIQKLVVRQHGETNRARNPHIATDEFRLLQIVQSAGIAVPTPYFCDETGEFLQTPCIIMEYVEGETEFNPANLTAFTHQLATCLSTIHRISSSQLSFLPKQTTLYEPVERPSLKTDWVVGESWLWGILQTNCPLLQHNPAVLLHGDFWPGNILWKEGQITAVIDWEDAMVGDPLADLANTRLEVLWAFGLEAMHSFTHHYQSLMNINGTNLPYWDIYTALRSAPKVSNWGLEKTVEVKMRQALNVFVAQASKQL